jgi:hypothetical protein
MKRRLTGLLFAAACLLLLTRGAIGGQRDAKPIRKTVRAADGLNIVCEVRGKGETRKNQVDVVAADYRVVTLDQAGHGESGKDRKHWRVGSLAGVVESLVKALDLKAVILVGQSMGGAVALMASQRMPGKVIAVPWKDSKLVIGAQ